MTVNVNGRPPAEQEFSETRSGRSGRVPTCIRPQVAAFYAAGPHGNFVGRSKSADRARWRSVDNWFSRPVTVPLFHDLLSELPLGQNRRGLRPHAGTL